MIASFADKLTEDIFNGVNSRYARKFPQELHRKALIQLTRLAAVSNLNDLTVPPSNRLETLKGDLIGFYSIRVNDQYRIIFRWDGKNADDVQIIDYH